MQIILLLKGRCNMASCKKWLQKYAEQIKYLIFGVQTTIVNYLVFWLIVHFSGENYALTANAAAFVVATIFAYITNKLFVFQSRSWKGAVLLREFFGFAGARIFSFLLEEAGLLLCMEVLHAEKFVLLGISGLMIAKIALSFIAVLLNYIFSKYLIFSRKKS